MYLPHNPSEHPVHIPPATKPNNLLTEADAGQSHTLHGWLIIPNRKLSKQIQFLQLRDSQGDPSNHTPLTDSHATLTSETPVAVTGVIRLRPENQRRQDQGIYELEITQIHPLNTIKFQLPFYPSQAPSVNAATRAKYRYLDLRYKPNFDFLRLRDEIIGSCRSFL